MEERVGLLGIPRLVVETVAWTFTAAGIAMAVVLVGLRARRPTHPERAKRVEGLPGDALRLRAGR